MMFSILFLVFFFGFSTAIEYKKCTDDSQCSPNECCQIPSEFQIVSRRGLGGLGLPDPSKPLEGTCHLYKNEGSFCDPFAQANGYCSCAPGFMCHGEEVLTATMPSIITRRDMRPTRPGYHWEYRCTKRPS